MSVIKKRYTKSEKMVIEDLAKRYAVHENTIRRWCKEYRPTIRMHFQAKAMKFLQKSSVRLSDYPKWAKYRENIHAAISVTFCAYAPASPNSAIFKS